MGNILKKCFCCDGDEPAIEININCCTTKINTDDLDDGKDSGVNVNVDDN